MELTIEALGSGGEGVARLDGYTVFVEGALPGEVVRAQFYEKKRRYGRAKLLHVLQPAPNRQAPPCPHFGQCGGCQLMHLSYEAQLKAKRQRVEDALLRIGKLQGAIVRPCLPSPSPLAYRNKIQLPMGAGGRLGLYAAFSHTLIPIKSCKIHCPLGDRLFQEIAPLLKGYPIKHLLIKTAVHTGEALIILVTGERPDGALFALGRKIVGAIPEVKGVVHNYNPEAGNTVLGDSYETLAGQGAIEERLCGLFFNVSPASFFQVNPEQAEKIYEMVAELAELKGHEHLLDAYCGVGTLALILAGRVKQVTGIECVAAAIADAQENARKNNISNATFICAPAEEAIQKLTDVDVALVNPPRKGCEASFLEQLAILRPEKILYLSCDPATLARDLKLLVEKGYQVDVVQPFDMFPQTAHVETLVQLHGPV
jgi:23S rRNA (uracil1939-C5)-methyltransferase